MGILDGTLWGCQCFKDWTIIFFIGMCIYTFVYYFARWLFHVKEEPKDVNKDGK